MDFAVAIWFLAFGTIFILGTMAVVGLKIRQRRTWLGARGVVTGNSETTNRKNQTLFTPVIEFTATDGRKFVFASSVATSWHSYQPGDSVRVIYNPGFPDDAEIVSFARLWMTPLTFVVIGIVLVAVGVSCLRHA